MLIRDKVLFFLNMLTFSSIVRLMKFFLVGGVGMLINFVLLFVFTEFFGWYYMLSAVVVGLLNTTYNFFANHFWSFSDRNDINVTSGYAKFATVMVIYFITYQIMLYVFTEFVFKDWSWYFVKDYMISAIVATGLSTIPKYLLCMLWVWKKEETI